MNFDDLLIKPNIEPFDSNTQRIRRNLLVASILGIVLTSGSASFDGTHSGLLGVKLEQINIQHFYYLLLASLGYFLLHFVWAAFDDLKANRLRLTGIRVPEATVASYAASSTFEPNVSQKNQSTLFSWWKGHKNKFEHLEMIVESIEGNVQKGQFEPAINTAKQQIEELNSRTAYIEAALLKFEKGYWQYQRSQLIRWFLLDFGIPFLLAIISILCVVMELVTQFTA
ncbi:hypothetical protein ACQKP8_27125 [Photobacterium alginatilyticum]|uniref:hypothetical protein n=1 Tax=Photobacterium alginatilyticum TaxID=1775171 RepID=UPI0040681981